MITTALQSKIVLIEQPGYFQLRAACFIPQGESILQIQGIISPVRTRHSIQVSDDSHISADLLSANGENSQTHWRYLNHSCEPNTWLRFPDLQLIALRDIQEGEELAYNYLTTEWELTCPFDCICNSADCFGTISGYRFLGAADRRSLRPIVAPHLMAREKMK